MKLTFEVLKKILGILLIILGLFIFVTPFTPGSWLFFVGLELLGVRLVFWNKLQEKLNNKKDK